MEFNVHNLVKWFQLKYPKVVKSMKEANHHYSGEELNPYHLESDVFTHTMMVVLEASRYKGAMDDNLYNQVLICALLHDIGKPMARRENHEKKRVNFYSHEPLSAFLAIDILNKIEEEFKITVDRRVVLEAIAMHTEVFKLTMEKLEERLINNPILAKVLMSLSNADHSGRFYDMGDRITEGVSPKITFDPKKEKKVIVNVGLPCAGKSTTSNRKGFSVISRDDIVMELALEQGITEYNKAFDVVDQEEVDRQLNKRTSLYIREEKDVLIDMTNMSRKARKKRLRPFKDYHKVAHVYMTSLLNIEERNKLREGKTIPAYVIEKMCKSFYPPLYDEFDEIIWRFNG